MAFIPKNTMVPNHFSKKLLEALVYGTDMTDKYSDHALFLSGVVRKYMKDNYAEVFQDVWTRVFAPGTLGTLAHPPRQITAVISLKCNIHGDVIGRELEVFQYDPEDKMEDIRVMLVGHLAAKVPDAMYKWLWEQNGEDNG